MISMHAQEALSAYMLVFQSEFWHLVHDIDLLGKETLKGKRR